MAFDFGFKQLKGGFFDAEAIKGAAAKAEAKAQSKFGAFTRRRMKSSIKYAPGKSAPGSPPHAHAARGYTREKKNKKTGAATRQTVSPLRELIFFARDPATQSVVIGPVVFGGKGGVAPRLVEQGGVGTFKDSRTGASKLGAWEPRPFAEPAGRAEAAKFPELLRGMVN